MDPLSRAFLIASLPRYALIAAGFAVAYWGYQLFKLGYFEKGGELKAAYGGNHLLVKQVAPGVFFAALGVIAMAVAVARPIQVSIPVPRATPTTAARADGALADGIVRSNPCANSETITGQGPKSKSASAVSLPAKTD